MTTKALARRSSRRPVAKMNARKEATPNSSTEVGKRLARWKFLEAEQLYKSSIAKTAKESEGCINMHETELAKIAGSLAKLRPSSFYDVLELLWFVNEQTKDGEVQCNGLELKIIRNVTKSLPGIHLADQAEARKNGVAGGAKELLSTLITFIDTAARQTRP